MKKNIGWITGIIVVIILTLMYYLMEKEFSETRWIMGTVCSVKVYARVKPVNAVNKAFSVMEKIDSLAWSEGNGDIGRLNRGEDVTLSKEVIEIIEEGIKIGTLTNGAFDITIRPLIKLWKDVYAKGISSPDRGMREGKYVPEESEIEKVLPLVNYKNIKIEDGKLRFVKKGMEIDLSGIAKGYAVDKAVEILKKEGIKKGLVSAGGDIRVFGDKTFKIGIKHPRKEGIINTLKLKNSAVATSGDYENFFIKDNIRYHHILNPKTGYPVRECMSVTVIAENAITADGLATGIFVLGKEKGKILLDSLGFKGFIYP